MRGTGRNRRTSEHFDFIVVGAGSSGCVLANRLTADGRTRVLLLEAGPPGRNPWLHIPGGFFRVMHEPSVTWRYETEPNPQLDGRRIAWPRGRVLGGTSAINGMVHIRGHRSDYDHWAALGNPGWDYDTLADCFRAVEWDTDMAPAPPGHAAVMLSTPRVVSPLHDAFLSAAAELGFARPRIFDAEHLEGAAPYQLSIGGRRRSSAARAFLSAARRRPNLVVRSRATAERILVENGRAAHVRYHMDGAEHIASADREVIVAAGAIGSPHLLQLSGIGDAGTLRRIGIDVHAHLPGVGANLQDHLAGRVVMRVGGVVTLNEISRSLIHQGKAGIDYMLSARGPLMMGAAPFGLFARTRPELSAPDMQFFFLSGSAGSVGGRPHDFPGCTISFYACHPQSRGRLYAVSPDIRDKPAIEANYLDASEDRDSFLRGLMLARRLFATRAFSGLVEAEMLPGPGIASADEVLAYYRKFAGTAYHPVGTCRMGHDPGTVVDAALRVRGIGGLRVIDASIMPTIVSGNTNAAALMIGEKGSRLVLGRD